MSEADLFRQYAKEAMRKSSEVTNENEKQSLIDLACTWVLAALMSEKVIGSSFTSSPRDVAEGASPTRQIGIRQTHSGKRTRHPRSRLSVGSRSVTKNLDCGPSIRRRRQTAALIRR